MARKKKKLRYRTEKQILKLLDQAERLERGKQKAWLKKNNLSPSHLYYWRRKYGYM